MLFRSNAVAPKIFHAGDKAAARRSLGLPESKLLIGTAGALTRARGIETLYHAYTRLKKIQPDVSLVLAGRSDRSMESLVRDDIIYFGNLSHERVGDLFRALDVGVVCNRDDEFGRYCFPQKFFEMLACRLPVVAANVGAMRGLLPGSEQHLFNPTSGASLVNAIVAQLGNSQRPAISVPSWQDCGSKFGDLIEAAVTAPMRSIGALEATQLTPKRL